MARIAGIELPKDKRIDIALTAIYGIGRQLSDEILFQAQVDPAKPASQLTSGEVTKLQKIVDQYPVEGTLRQRVADNIKRLKAVGTYRGQRHAKNLPVRGQRTRTNARTKRGRKRTIGAMRKKDLSRVAKTKGKVKEEEDK